MGEGLLYSKSSGGLIYYGGRLTLWHRTSFLWENHRRVILLYTSVNKI